MRDRTELEQELAEIDDDLEYGIGWWLHEMSEGDRQATLAVIKQMNLRREQIIRMLDRM